MLMHPFLLPKFLLAKSTSPKLAVNLDQSLFWKIE